MTDSLPPPIRTDGSNAFAHHSMAVRVPSIIEEIAARNPDYAPAIRQRLMRLRDALTHDEAIALFDPPAPDHDLWAELIRPHRGATWLGASWFFAEMYAYRLILEAVRYWSTLRDPFAPFKAEELASGALWTVLGGALAQEGSLEERLILLLEEVLWGNRIDLSLKDVAARGTAALTEHLLANDIPAAVEYLLGGGPGEVHLVIDNAGTEEALDLALADLLLQSGVARVVMMHVKMQPVLVSDVIVADVHHLLAAMTAVGGEVAALADRLREQLDTGRLRIVPDFFWNTHGCWWELPPRLYQAMHDATLIVAKGDVNYRRATNDALWPADARLPEALHALPAPLLLLRTLKSDTLVGVDPDLQAQLDAREGPGWRTSGTYGVAQLAIR